MWRFIMGIDTLRAESRLPILAGDGMGIVTFQPHGRLQGERFGLARCYEHDIIPISPCSPAKRPS
jgi:hypothetical protein